MPAPEHVTTVMAEWVAKAENDLKAADLILSGPGCPTDAVCFHAQQAVEKYLKALLVMRGIPFPKTHHIRTLVKLLPPDVKVELSDDEQDQLTEFATGARYPGWGEISLADSRWAIAVARRLRRDVRRLLPRAALDRSKRLSGPK